MKILGTSLVLKASFLTVLMLPGATAVRRSNSWNPLYQTQTLDSVYRHFNPRPHSPDQGSGQHNPQYPSPDQDQRHHNPQYPSPDQGSGQHNPQYPSPDQGSGQHNPQYSSPDQGSGQHNPQYPSPDQGLGQRNPQYPSPDQSQRHHHPQYPSPDQGSGQHKPQYYSQDQISGRNYHQLQVSELHRYHQPQANQFNMKELQSQKESLLHNESQEENNLYSEQNYPQVQSKSMAEVQTIPKIEKMSSVLTAKEKGIIKEEMFLESIYEKLGRPKHIRKSSSYVNMIQQIFRNMEGTPGIISPVDRRLIISLEEYKNQGVDKFVLWVPQDWTAQKKHNHNNDGFIPLDLTNELNSRVATGDSTLEISIGIPIKPNQKAFTDIVTRKEQERKKRESTEVPQCGAEEQSCCLSSVSVNLTSIGWDFVLNPQVIEFTYCGGHCDPFRVPPGMFVPQMAALRWKIHMSGLHNLPAPCCSPREYGNLEILYFDNLQPDGSVEVKSGTLQNVLATSCRCS